MQRQEPSLGAGPPGDRMPRTVRTKEALGMVWSKEVVDDLGRSSPSRRSGCRERGGGGQPDHSGQRSPPSCVEAMETLETVSVKNLGQE